MIPYLSASEIMIRGLKDENNEYLQQTFLVKQVSQRGRSVFFRKKRLKKVIM